MDFEVSGTCCIWAALICLTLPLQWVLSAVAAAIIHEACHILAVFLAGGRINSIKIGTAGAVMDASELPEFRQILCILAGPVGSFSLVLAAGQMPKLAFCGLVHGLYNLLPIYPLDGGRLLACIAKKHFSPKSAHRICEWTKWTVMFVLFIFVLWMIRQWKTGIMPLLILLVMVYKTSSGKIPCKEGDLGVQ